MTYRNWADVSEQERARICREQPAEELNAALTESIRGLMDEVKAGGEQAVIAITERFDNVQLTQVVRTVADLIAEAEALLSTELKAALDLAINRSGQYSRLQLDLAGEFSGRVGEDVVGQLLRPLDSVAAFVPAGKGSFPSVLVHVAAPAVEAGVKSVIVLTSPDQQWAEGGRFVDPAVVYVAARLGIQQIVIGNGPAVVAAATYGLPGLPPVQMIVGPGSLAIVAAQNLAAATGIITQGGLGPTDSFIIAEAPANPEVLAADLISEAEHGSESAVVLLSTSEELLQAVGPHVDAQLSELPAERQQHARDAIANGGVFLVASIDEAIGISNRFAPEHLLLLTADNEKNLQKVTSAGTVLLGPSSPFAASSFTAGPPATLPTTGAARTLSGVTALSYMKRIAVLGMNEQSLQSMSAAIQEIAMHERFPAHVASLARRYPDRS